MKTKSILTVVIFYLLISMLSSCLAPKEAVKEETVRDEPLVVEEQKNSSISEESVILIENDLENREMVDGYRVKVASKNNLDEANSIEKKIVENIDVPVYIDFIVDRYMVYAGDCQNKKEVDELKGKLKALGFTKIYSVPKKVYKKEKYVTEKVNYIGDVVVKNSKNEVEKTLVDENIYGEKILGYRIQIFAGLNKENAQGVKKLAESKINEKVYILLKDNLFKVQIGDVKSRIEADNLRDKLESDYNFSGAFIVPTLIFKKVNEGSTQNVKTTAEKGFYIQIGAYSSISNANKLLEMATVYGYDNSSVSSEDDLHKVLIGKYDSREGAEIEKEKLIGMGFEGAWILER